MSKIFNVYLPHRATIKIASRGLMLNDIDSYGKYAYWVVKSLGCDLGVINKLVITQRLEAAKRLDLPESAEIHYGWRSTPWTAKELADWKAGLKHMVDTIPYENPQHHLKSLHNKALALM